MIWFFAFLATVPAANWLIGNVGRCLPDGPCVVPVGFGFEAPSGVLVVGLALVFRDLLHSELGWRWALAAIAGGTLLSYLVADPAVVAASVAAFAAAELLNQLVYAPLYRRRLIIAVVLSSLLGAVADSAIFLWLAFGSLAFIEGQVLGKVWMIGLAALAIALLRARRPAAP